MLTSSGMPSSEFGNPLTGRRNQREQQALAVEFLEIESFLGEDRGAAAGFAGEVAEVDGCEFAHGVRTEEEKNPDRA